MTALPNRLRSGFVVNSRFLIEEFLGVQDLGFLYLCCDLEAGRRRARLRILSKDEFGTEVSDSLGRELSLLRRLRHPNLARVLDFGIVQDSGELFLVEEWIEGKDICSGTEGKDSEEILRLLLELTSTLRYLHMRGIIHGCLNPSSVILSRNGDARNLRLLDFGLLRCLPNWSPWSRSGTVPYLAPEILTGGKVSEDSDLYSLGILIYQLLTRHLPFEDEDPGFLVQKHLQVNVDLRPVERLRGGSGLAQLLCNLLEKDPSKRSGAIESVEQSLRSMLGEDDQSSQNSELAQLFSGSRFVGRDGEMRRLRQIAERVRGSGRGFTVFIEGEAGCGKTRCMEELRNWALLRGWRVVEGSCGAHEDKSYGPFRQVFARTEPSGGESIFRFDDVPRAAESGSFESSPEFATGQFRDLLTRELVRRLSGHPTLLFLHDFHLADEATSAVLDYLSSDIQSHQILMCVSLRLGEESASVGRVMELTVRQDRGEVIILEGLTEENVGQLVAGILGDTRLTDTLGKWMFGRIGGNPFFLEEMLKHLIELGPLRWEKDNWEFRDRGLLKSEIPASIGAVLLRRLTQLPALARDLVDWLALFQRPVTKRLLSAVTGLTRDDLSGALRQLGNRQIIRTEVKDGAETVELSHVLVSEVIKEKLSQVRRRKMHGRIAETLEREPDAGGNLQEMAMHAMEGRLGTKAVRLALALASQTRAEFSHEKALYCFEYVIAHKGDLTEEELCHAAIEASETMLALGMPKQAIRLLKSQMRRQHRFQNVSNSRMFMELAMCYKHLGEFRRLELCCRKGLSLLPPRNHAEGVDLARARFWAELAFGAIMKSRPRLGLDFLEQAIANCSNQSAGALSGRIHILAASLHRITCSLHAACKSAEKAVNILSDCEDVYLSCSAHSTLGSVSGALGRFSHSLAQHKQAAILSEKSRSLTIRSQALGNMAECLCRMGNLKAAIATADFTADFVTESNNSAVAYAFNLILAEIRLAAGEYGSAAAILDQLRKSSKPALYFSGQAQFLAANLSFILGRFDESLKHIRKLIKFEIKQAPFFERELAEALGARILSERGQPTLSIKQLWSLYRRVAKKRWPYQMCMIKLQLADVLLGANQLDSAKKAARDALRLATGMQAALLISQGHFILGKIYAESGSSANGTGAFLDHAIMEMQSACTTLNESVPTELAWRVHAELSLLFARISQWDHVLDHAEKAEEILSKLESQVPSEILPSYLEAFGRKRLKIEVEQAKATCRDLQRDEDVAVAEFRDSENSRIMLRMSAAISSGLDLGKLMEGILDQVIKALTMERAFVLLRDETTGTLRVAKGRNYRLETLLGLDLIKGGFFDSVFEQGKPIVSADAQIDPRLNDDLSMSAEIGKLFCAPLKVPGRTLGVLYADNSSPVGSLNESEVNLFAAFCNLAAMAIDNAMAHHQLAKEKSELQEYLHNARDEYPEIVGRSAAIEMLRDRIGLAAASPLDVLIIGESGTGKELVARAIHRTGRRKGGKFIPVDCGSLSDTLAEAELFGYRKGAFTGAMENRQGLLEAAQKGIIFLDEVSNLPVHLQAKLLRVLQEREVRRIGETMPRNIDIQVLAATNIDPLEAIKKGKFRKDLYYRLRIMEIRVPPLRDRSGDIPLLLEWFFEQIAQSEGGRSKRLSQEAKEVLSKYNYPGNIRELKNIVSEAYYSAKGERIDLSELPLELRYIDDADSVPESVAADRLYAQITDGIGDFEKLARRPFMDHQFGVSVVRDVIKRALRDSGGNYRRAFSLLKIPVPRYSMTMQFLKRHNCYVDFRPFRRMDPS